MGKVREILEFIAEESPKSEKIKEAIKEWISSYDGKIIGFRVNGNMELSKWKERYHLIIYFKDDELIMKLGEGDSPSPEVIFCIANDADGLEIFRNPGMLMKLIQSGKIWVIANLNEGLQFCTDVLSRDPELVKIIAEMAV